MKKHLLLLVFALLPMFTMADEGGTCGKDVSYSFETATVTIGSGVKKIGNYAFSSGVNLSSINVNMNIPTAMLQAGRIS